MSYNLKLVFFGCNSTLKKKSLAHLDDGVLAKRVLLPLLRVRLQGFSRLVSKTNWCGLDRFIPMFVSVLRVGMNGRLHSVCE